MSLTNSIRSCQPQPSTCQIRVRVCRDERLTLFPEQVAVFRSSFDRHVLRFPLPPADPQFLLKASFSPEGCIDLVMMASTIQSSPLMVGTIGRGVISRPLSATTTSNNSPVLRVLNIDSNMVQDSVSSVIPPSLYAHES